MGWDGLQFLALLSVAWLTHFMITLGIDLSSMREGTAACMITWHKNSAVAASAASGCCDEKLYELIAEADAVGIDAPFGWPKDFVAAVADWTSTEWSTELRDRLQFRETDRVVRQHTGRLPLSVSSDRIALPAMRAMALLRQHKVTDRSGTKGFYEVYPAGSLYCWKLTCRGYKRLDDECLGTRNEILRNLRIKFPWLEAPDSYADTSDCLDALVASLTARAAVCALTVKPAGAQLNLARREGWIHLPKEDFDLKCVPESHLLRIRGQYI